MEHSEDTEKGQTSHHITRTRSSTIDIKEEDIVVEVVKEEEDRDVALPMKFPEGGLRGWLTIAGAFLVQYTSFGYINAFGVYQDFYVREYLLDFTPSDIGWIGGVQVFLNFSMGAFTGKIFDRGYFNHLMIGSILFHAIALFMLSLSHQNSYYQVFLTNGIAFGLGSGLSYVPSLGIAGHYFHRRRALAVGIISSGSALGAVIHPIMLNKLFNGPVGFHNGVRISAALNLFLLILAFLLMRTRLPPKKVQHFPILQWLQEPAYLSFMISSAFLFLGLFFPVFYLQLDAVTHGIDETFAFYSLSILNAASIIGRTAPGSLAPRLGVYNLGTFFTIGTGVVVFCMAAMKDEVGTVVFAIFFGFFSGASIALTPAMIAHLAKDASEIGTRLGLYFGVGGILGLFATPISGALLTSDYHWINPILFAAISMTIGGIFYGVSRHFVAKQHRTHII